MATTNKTNTSKGNTMNTATVRKGKTMTKNVRVFVEGTQRGYAVGIKRTVKGCERTVKETYFHDDGSTAGIDRAYREASAYAASLQSTLKRKPALLRRQGWL